MGFGLLVVSAVQERDVAFSGDRCFVEGRRAGGYLLQRGRSRRHVLVVLGVFPFHPADPRDDDGEGEGHRDGEVEP